MSYKRSSGQTSQKAAVAVPVPPLGVADQAFFQAVINDVAPGWTVELDGICADEASLILVPDGGEDDLGPSFCITRESYGLRLDQVQWDAMTEVGIYASTGGSRYHLPPPGVPCQHDAPWIRNNSLTCRLISALQQCGVNGRDTSRGYQGKMTDGEGLRGQAVVSPSWSGVSP